MKVFRRLFSQCVFPVGLVLVAVRPCVATNGMNLIGFGPESISMGGADLAVTDSPSAMNINPAGIGHCARPELALGLSYMWPSLLHTDALGNNRKDDLGRRPIPFVGYVHPIGDLTWGAGFFFQGGIGAEFEALRSPPAAMAGSGLLPTGFFSGDSVPATDDTRTRVAFAKFTPSVAWRANPNWTLGASFNVGYARAEMRLLPETSVAADLDMSGTEGDSPRDFFFGMDLEDTDSIGYGLRTGFQFQRGDLELGGSYFTATALDLDGGTMTLNLSALGLEKVDYDARIDGFNWPRRAGIGFGYRLNPSFLVAGDLEWIDWSSAINTLSIAMSNPDHPMAPPTRVIPFRMDWHDQWVYAMGMEMIPAPDLAIRLGYNHGDAPIPESTLRPLFPAIAEDHVTAGLGVSKRDWTFDLTLEYVLETETTNLSSDAALNPFGPGSTEQLSQFVAHLMVRKVVGADTRNR